MDETGRAAPSGAVGLGAPPRIGYGSPMVANGESEDGSHDRGEGPAADGGPAGGRGETAAALETLADSLKRLEAAVERRRVADRSLSSAEDIVQRLNEDRAELARRLDAAEARAERRAEANRIVSARLVKIMEMVRAVLDGRARDA